MLLRRSSDEVNSGLLFKLDSGDSVKTRWVLGGKDGFVRVIRGWVGDGWRLRATVTVLVVFLFSPRDVTRGCFAIDGW